MIFHLAAQLDVRVSVAQPVFDAEVNVLGSLNVCEGALAAGTRKVVFAGSGGTLYGVPEEPPGRARAIRSARSRRTASSKKAAGDYLHYYREVRGLEYTELALANVYGPRQDPTRRGRRRRDLRRAACSPAASRPIFGDGAQTRDFVFVDDVVDAFVRATEKGGGLLMNIGTGVETSVHELYDAMARLTGYARAAEPRAGACRRAASARRSTPAVPRSTSAGSRGRRSTTASPRTLDWFRTRTS